jgi:hypothetical protein
MCTVVKHVMMIEEEEEEEEEEVLNIRTSKHLIE